MKTARFTTIVQSAGAPSVHPLWLAPDQDKALQKALKEQRVLTVHQDVRGSRKDFGTVGLVQEPEAQFLVFPKSLRRFAGQRVVGIDYELLARDPMPTSGPAPKPKPTKSRETAAASRPESKPKREPPSPRRRPAPSAAPILPFEVKAEVPALPPAKAPAAKTQARKPSLPKRTDNGLSTSVAPKLLQELRRVRTDLKAGKAVAAYERLDRLLDQLEH